MNGFGPYEARRVALGGVTHLERIAIGKIRRNIAMIADWNIGAFLSQLDVIPVVVKTMRKQSTFSLGAARYNSEQHRLPPMKE
jgi:hypothetical protein